FHQVRRLLDDLPDRLVGAGDLVQDAGVLSALDSLSLARQILAGESPLGLSTRHLSPRAMGRALAPLPVSEAAEPERARSHQYGNDPQLPRSRANRPFARHEHAFSEMHFIGDVIVVAVDRHGQTEPADVALESERMGELPQEARHHDFSIGKGVVLTPVDVLAISLKIRRPLEKIGEAPI